MADELTRTYTIPLRRSFRRAASYTKTNRAVKAVRAFLQQHMKAEEVRLGQHLNKYLWQHGIKNPPPRVTVVAIKDGEGVVRAELEGKGFSESVKPMPKEEEATGLKDRLVDKLAGPKEREAPEGQSATSEAAPKNAPAATEAKQAEKKKAPEKEKATPTEKKAEEKPAAKGEAKETTPPKKASKQAATKH